MNPLSLRSHLGCDASGMSGAALANSSRTGKGQRTVLPIESVARHAAAFQTRLLAGAEKKRDEVLTDAADCSSGGER